jgi:hypothetical protein
MVVNRDSGLIQENPDKCKIESGKRQTPSLKKKTFLETEIWLVASAACVCMWVVY